MQEAAAEDVQPAPEPVPTAGDPGPSSEAATPRESTVQAVPAPPAFREPAPPAPEEPAEPLERPDITANLFPETRASRPVLRHGHAGDAAALIALLATSKAMRWFKQSELARLYASAESLPLSDAQTRAALEAYVHAELAPRDLRRSWVAHVQGRIVGVAFLRWTHEEMLAHYLAVLDNLYVHPSWRERGVGTQLLNACRASARVVEASTILLSRLLESVRPSPKRFFLNRGFEQTTLGHARTP